MFITSFRNSWHVYHIISHFLALVCLAIPMPRYTDTNPKGWGCRQ
jgi:hypothetical protein